MISTQYAWMWAARVAFVCCGASRAWLMDIHVVMRPRESVKSPRERGGARVRIISPLTMC